MIAKTFSHAWVNKKCYLHVSFANPGVCHNTWIIYANCPYQPLNEPLVDYCVETSTPGGYQDTGS